MHIFSPSLRTTVIWHFFNFYLISLISVVFFWWRREKEIKTQVMTESRFLKIIYLWVILALIKRLNPNLKSFWPSHSWSIVSEVNRLMCFNMSGNKSYLHFLITLWLCKLLFHGSPLNTWRLAHKFTHKLLANAEVFFEDAYLDFNFITSFTLLKLKEFVVFIIINYGSRFLLERIIIIPFFVVESSWFLSFKFYIFLHSNDFNLNHNERELLSTT